MKKKDLLLVLSKDENMINLPCHNRMKNKDSFHFTNLIIRSIILIFLMFSGIFVQPAMSQTRQMEYLTRGLVAVKTGDNIFLSWRIYATDSLDLGFNIYRNDTLVNEAPITGKSNFIDTAGTVSDIYHLETLKGVESVEISTVVVPWENKYLTIPLQTPDDYTPNDASVADLDGDGEYEIVVKMEGATRDNSQSGTTDPVYLHAYEMNGSFLWSINLGINIRGGAHYTQFMVYDLDGDGKAEVACKTAPGTSDGSGEFLSTGPAADDYDTVEYRNSNGYILSGPEYLTVFDGETGEEINTVGYIPLRSDPYPLNTWGDTYGNRVDRFLACVAYFDSIPSLVMCRGYYDRTTLTAWDFKDKQLVERWAFDTQDDLVSLGQYEDQGAHSIAVGDVDNDGKDEIMYGAMAFDDDGSPLYNTDFRHGDATHLGDLIPNREGQEFFMPHEGANGTTIPGVSLRDAATGDIIWSKTATGDIGRGMTADISSAHAGNEFWAAGGLGVYNSSGTVISSSIPPINFAVWWDGDLLREMLDGTTVSKWGYGNLFTAGGCSSNNSSKSNPALSGDILGDWREEVMFRTSDNQSLRIYTTTIPTEYGWYTLMQDPQYRQAIVWQNVAYPPPPHPSFFIGHGMDTVPAQDIHVIDPDSVTHIAINNPLNGVEIGLGLDVSVIIAVRNISDTEKRVFLANDSVVFDTLNAPYFKKISGLTSGDYSYTASCYNKAEELITSLPVVFSVDEGYPHINITSPEDGALFLPADDSIEVTANAWDTDGQIDSIEFYLDDILLASVVETPYSYKLENPGIGLFDIKAVAYDNDGKSTETSIGIEIGEIFTIQENEAGYCGFVIGGSVDSNHEGFTGDGFSNTDNAVGEGLIYGVTALPGDYTFVFRYALESGERGGNIMINDTVDGGRIDFPATGSWTGWDVTSATVTLPQGIVKIALIADTDGGLTNIDYLKIIASETGSAPAAVSCDILPQPPNRIETITLQNNGFVIYPVPAKTSVHIGLIDQTDRIHSVAIYSLEGSLVLKEENLNDVNTSLNIEGLSSKLYFMYVTTDKQVMVKKFIVN